jgi:hypothetical protein
MESHRPERKGLLDLNVQRLAGKKYREREDASCEGGHQRKIVNPRFLIVVSSATTDFTCALPRILTSTGRRAPSAYPVNMNTRAGN